MKTAAPVRSVGIFALMVVGVLGLAGNPVLALWVSSRLTHTNAPVAGPYAVTAIIIAVGTITLCWFLGKLVHAYNNAVGYDKPYVRRAGTLQSGGPQDPGSLILGHVLLVAFVIAGVAGAIWFFFFAGSSI